MRADMLHQLVLLCNHGRLIWARLVDVIGGDITWRHLQSECIRSALVSIVYLEKAAFRMLWQPPWVYTQHDIPAHVANIRDTPEHALPSDETTLKIAQGLANGVPEGTFIEALELLREASMSTNVNERAHGYAAQLHRDHKQYGYETVAER